MNRLTVFAGLLALSCGAAAHAQTLRFFVDTTTDLIASQTYVDETPTPAGHEAVEYSAIATACTCAPEQGGTWVSATSTYTPPIAANPALRLKRRLHDAYIWWRINGRTEHWVSLRDRLDEPARSIPMRATDTWAFHLVALGLVIVNGEWPTGANAYTVPQIEAAVDHIENILLTLGPTWYQAQIAPSPPEDTESTMNARQYALRDSSGTSLATDGSAAIYSDAFTAPFGVARTVDGAWTSMGAFIPNGFNPENPTLVNP